MHKVLAEVDMVENTKPDARSITYVPGPVHYYLNGRDVCEQEFHEALAEPHEVSLEAKPPNEGKPNVNRARQAGPRIFAPGSDPGELEMRTMLWGLQRRQGPASLQSFP
ncbi:MAG: hypothetical protein LAP85_24355 [Acidobacteriia bacterium]|nr:hypothetical protein [Terriglobia bacterium]